MPSTQKPGGGAASAAGAAAAGAGAASVGAAGGGVAVWASSGFTNAQPQVFLNQALLTALAQNPSSSLGAAILAAKSGITDADVRRTWILFGDPAMQLQFAGPSNQDHRTTDMINYVTELPASG